MPISPELQAKIDALEDEDFKARILRLLTGNANKLVSDEEIFENSLANHIAVKEQRARLRNWQEDEVAAFASYFKEKRTDDYVEFLRQENEFNEIEARLAWKVRRLILEWTPGLDESDITGLFSKFRDYAKLHNP